MVPFISSTDVDSQMDWVALTDALAQGHQLPHAQVADTFLYRGADTLLSRSAFIDGMGIAVKSATVFPDNPSSGKPMVNGSVTLFGDLDGLPEAFIDFHLVTKWKTAGDSLLAARRLARPDSRNILIVGAGTVGRTVHSAYSAVFPSAVFQVWNRTPATAAVMADQLGIEVAVDLANAVSNADIIICSTMSTEPLVRGEWLQPGTHLDLIGAYRPDMRETDDAALLKARIFVDSFDTTLNHIGELKIPLEAGVIDRGKIIADFYDLAAFKRVSASDVTVFKNGGGAHLDLMTARYILDRWKVTVSLTD